MTEENGRNKRGKYGKHPFLAALVLFIFALIYTGSSLGGGEDDDKQPTGRKPPAAAAGAGTNGSGLCITYLDVGQADCTILQCDGQTMLIDAGNRADAKVILNALETLEIEKFDYAVATHSHEDHIGAMAAVLREVPADYVVYYPEQVETKVYKDFLKATEEIGAVHIEPELLKEYNFGEGKFQILAPNEEVCKDPNNCSVAVMVVYGKNKFLFTGDAEEQSEQKMLELGTSLEVDVFQTGHHGSSTSNSEAFLKAADPVYAIISCGEGNRYGHPHSEVLARLVDFDVMVYRTDTMGTITLVSDGTGISISTEKSADTSGK